MSCFLLNAQTSNSYLPWSSERKLKWSDFKSIPPKKTESAAVTNTHLGFSYKFVNSSISHTIECRFNKYNSWGRIQNDWILQHEQAHFDIAEIFARQLHKAILEYTFNKITFQEDLNAIYERIAAEEGSFQLQYDEETENSRNKPKQEEWLKKIEQRLQELSLFSNYN